MMSRLILFSMFIATICCMPQNRFNRPLSQPALISSLRQAQFLNTAPAPIQNLEPEPHQIRLSLPVRKPLNQLPLERPTDESLDYDILQNQNAKYEFSSNIEDHINDQTQQREETRDGSAVKGSYSYSDGYYKRTVHYEADENGYRVIGMEAIPLDGPHIDLMGTASVSNLAHGTQLKYKVVSVPAPGPVGRIIDH